MKHHHKGAVAHSGLDLVHTPRPAQLSRAAIDHAVQRIKLCADFVARISRIERLRQTHFVAVRRSGEVSLRRTFGLGKHGEQPADHAAFPGTHQVEMTIVRTGKKIPATLAILGDVLHGIVVAVEDRDFPVLVHRHSKTVRHRQDSL